MPTANAFNSDRGTSERIRTQLEVGGIFAENFPRQSANATSGLVSGSIYFMGIGLATGDRVSNLCFICTTLASGFSGINMRVGLYTKAGVQVASSGDVSALFTSTGGKVCPLSPQANGDPFYTVPVSDLYYAAVISIATTGAILERGRAGAGFTFGSNSAGFGVQLAQTDLTAPATISTTNTNAIAFYVGVS